ncbi:MAG: hypothetical protein CME70_11825 [Halobacteriovorax sp.]|nr:hypothetical protein [Halobacteriovorax sp.]
MLIITLLVTSSIMAKAPEQKGQKNHQANIEAAQAHVDFLLNNLDRYPANIGVEPKKKYDSFAERVAAVDEVFASYSVEAGKRDPFFESSNTTKPIVKFFNEVLSEYESAFLEINGKKATDKDRKEYIERKFPGVKYESLKKLLVTSHKAQRKHAQKDQAFWDDLSKKKEGLVSVWPELSNAVHPKITAAEFKKYLPELSQDSDCSIKKIETLQRSDGEYLRIFINDKTFFDVKADAITVNTPFSRGYKSNGTKTPFSIELGKTQWTDEHAILRFDKDGVLKKILFKKIGTEINTAWIDSLHTFLNTGSYEGLSKEHVDKKINYRCEVDASPKSGELKSTASKALMDSNREAGKHIPAELDQAGKNKEGNSIRK